MLLIGYYGTSQFIFITGKTLKKIDPERAAGIDSKNKRRLIRAIEITKELGRVPKIKKNSPYNPLFIGITPETQLPPESAKCAEGTSFLNTPYGQAKTCFLRNISPYAAPPKTRTAQIHCNGPRTSPKNIAEKSNAESGSRYPRMATVCTFR